MGEEDIYEDYSEEEFEIIVNDENDNLKTYKLDYENNTVTGMIFGEDIIKQKVICALKTPYFNYSIYSYFGLDYDKMLNGRYISEDTASDLADDIVTAITNVDGVSGVTDLEITFDKENVTVECNVILENTNTFEIDEVIEVV